MRGGELLGRRFDITLEAAAAGALAGLRVVVVIAALGLLSAAVDPDELLRLFRRISYRSALTASLATRLVPVLARDASRMSDAARCRPQPPGRLALLRAALTGALDRAVDVAAALEVRGYALAGRPRRRRRPWSRHDLRVAAAAAGIAGLALAAALLDVGAVTLYPTLTIATGPAELALCLALPAAGRRALRRASRAAGGGPWLSRWSAPSVSATATPRPAQPALREVSLTVEPGTFTVLAGLSGSGKSTLLRALCGLVPHFHGGDASGRWRSGGMDVRTHGPGELASVCGTVFQDPETQVVMGGRAGRARAAARAPGRARRRDRPRGGGDGAGAGGRRTCWSVGPRRSQAASCSAWRSPPPWCTGRGCSCSTSPPRSSTRWRATSWCGCCGG